MTVLRLHVPRVSDPLQRVVVEHEDLGDTLAMQDVPGDDVRCYSCRFSFNGESHLVQIACALIDISPDPARTRFWNDAKVLRDHDLDLNAWARLDEWPWQV